MTHTLIHLPSIRLGRVVVWWWLQFKPQDFWVGVFWQNYPGKVYIWICLIPCFPLHLEWQKPGIAGRRSGKGAN